MMLINNKSECVCMCVHMFACVTCAKTDLG